MEFSHHSDRPAVDPRDPAVFQRVWQRVTAGQEHSPVVPALPIQDQMLPAVLSTPQLLTQWIDRLSAALEEDLDLSRRCSGPAVRLLREQIRLLQRQLRRANAAYFLLTGQRCRPSEKSPIPHRTSLAAAMRRRWLRHDRWAQLLEEELRRAPCPLLRQFYGDMAAQSAAAAEEIFHFLEEFTVT